MSHTDDIAAHLVVLKDQQRVHDEAKAAQLRENLSQEEGNMLWQIIEEANRKYEEAYEWLQAHGVASVVWNKDEGCYEMEVIDTASTIKE